MPADAPWKLRYYRDGDEQGLLDCLTAAFGSWPSVEIAVPPIDHLRWKLTSDPVANDFHYVAEIDGRIVATTIVVVRPLRLGDETVRLANYTDFAFHPDFQGRGQMRPFWEFAGRSAADVFHVASGLSANDAIRKNMLAVGRLPLANGIELYERELATSPVLSCDIPMRTQGRFDNRVTALWETAAPSYRFCIERTADYLNWRYADPRAGCYTIRFAEEAGELLGYSVLGGTRSRGVIADLFAHPGRPDVLGSLVDDAVAFFEDAGRTAARCWSPRNHPLAALLRERGFQRIRPVDGLGFTAYPGASLAEPHSDAQLPVYYAVGDTDVI
jgi:hypothetical protein